MNQPLFRLVRRCVAALLFAFILICRFSHDCGEWYARQVYPSLSRWLSWTTAWVPFSLEECVVVGLVVWLIAYPFWAWRRGCRRRVIVLNVSELLLWVYVWFYWGWGINYFRHDFYQRLHLTPVAYDDTAFHRFLDAYADSLNNAYHATATLSHEAIQQEVKTLYTDYPSSFGLTLPQSYQHPKPVLFNRLYSSVGVLGFMGPFFSESQLNDDLLPDEYPFTYAHELAHLLGVSSEAEANFWAYHTCIRSREPYIRWSGYAGILGYVLINARMALSEADYIKWVERLRPEVKQSFHRKQEHWAALRSPLLDQIQSRLYEWYLKGNQIPNALKNYNEVVALVLSYETQRP